MQVLACWGGQVCMKRSEYIRSSPACPESRDQCAAVRQGEWTALEMQGWSLLVGGQMFCWEKQSNAGFWVCLHAGVGREGRR